MPRVMPIYGTRPEAIKTAPLVLALRDHWYEVPIAVTGQHREMLDQVNALFGLVPNHDLDVMRHGSSLSGITERTLHACTDLLASERPDAIVVQGDTTSAFAAALAAFYLNVPVFHLEAGLRTGDLRSPFPEEGNRRLVGQIADLHFAPTGRSRENLIREGIDPSAVATTGNTVIDALQRVASQPSEFAREDLREAFASGRRTLLVTAHRRESWGEPMREAVGAIAALLDSTPDLQVVLPLHRNPVVREVIEPVLGGRPGVWLTEPLDYSDFCQAMSLSYLILTDSGGVQEEAPSLGKPVLVMRDTTERPEAVDAGTVRLVGTGRERIVAEVRALLEDPVAYATMATAVNPYGDGQAANRVVAAIDQWFGIGQRMPDFVASQDRTA